MSWASIAAMLIAAVTGSTGLTWLFTARASGKKLNREAEKVGVDSAVAVSNMALSLIKPFEDQVARLSERVHVLEREVDSLNDRLQLAHRLLTEHAIPFPPPPTGP